MDERLVYRPTLVVGVGGTGCEIAEGVIREARANGLDGRGRLAVMGFDTDVNDIQQRVGIDRRNIVQTSSLDTIYQILDKTPEAEHGFCLGRNELPHRLLNMKLIEGAGQIRMLSHLALWDQLKRRATEIEATIGNVFADLARHDGRTEFAGALNIILCGSLAGATGSGSFVQIALLLRRIALDRGLRGVQVRGVFVLPDVFVRAASLGTQQIDNVLANGYASLRELNAVFARAENMEGAQDFVYEFAPGRALRSGEAPFEAVTFLDYENVAGGNLGANLANYKQLATRSVYLQTFTSVGKETLSRTINDALAGVEATSRASSNVYAAIGIAAVRYPASHMADYLAHRFAQEVVAGDWLRLDRLYREEVRRFEELKAAGNMSVRPPDVAVSFLEALDQFARRDRLAFFMDIAEKLDPVLVDPETREERRVPVDEQYLEAFLREVSETFWSGSRLAELRGRGAIDPTAFRLRERIETIVRQSENLLDSDFGALETAISEQPDRIFTNMITVEDERAVAELQPHHLRWWIERDGPHPVQVRAFLYRTLRRARAMRDGIDVTALRRAVVAVGDVFVRDRMPEAPTENDRRGGLVVLDRAREAARPGVVGRLTGATNRFVDEFVRYWDDSMQRMRAYGEGALRRKVLDALVAELEALVAVWEGLFAEVGRSLAAIDDLVVRLRARHADKGSFDGNVYVYADVASKAAAWEELRGRTIATRQSAAVNTALCGAVYEHHRSARKARRAPDYSALRGLFDREVVDNFARRAVATDHRAVWDLSVIEATRREAAITGVDWSERLREAVDLVKAQAEPFVRLQDPSDGQAMVFWAMPPSVREEYGDGGAFDRLFTFQQGERPLLAPDFSDRELLCVNSRVNLELVHLAKLDPGSDRGNVNEPTRGRYRRAYADRISRLLDEEMTNASVVGGARVTSVLTPHIHRDWHRASRMPEIFPEARRRIARELQRSVLVAFGLGLLQKETDYGRPITYFSTVGRLGSHSIRVALVEGHDDWSIYAAFVDRADLVRVTNGVWGAEKAALPRGGRFEENHTAIAIGGATAALRILEMAAPQDAARERRERAAHDLFEVRMTALWELAEVLLPHLGPEGRFDIVMAFVRRADAEAFQTFGRLEAIPKPTVDRLIGIHEAASRRGAEAMKGSAP